MKVRYIRDWLNGSNANTSNHWVEIQAFTLDGTNIALNKVPTLFAGTVQAANPITVITDGNTATATAYGVNPGLSCIQIDLGAIYDIASIIVWHYYGDSRIYNATKTQVSTDNTTYTNIFDSSVSGTYVETEAGKVHELITWSTPKVNWVAQPPVDTDINRLENNLAYLKTARHIDIADAGGYYTTKTVEFALVRLKKWILGL